MKDFDLWIVTDRKRRCIPVTIEDDETIESVELESNTENVSLIAKLQEKISPLTPVKLYEEQWRALIDSSSSADRVDAIMELIEFQLPEKLQ